VAEVSRHSVHLCLLYALMMYRSGWWMSTSISDNKLSKVQKFANSSNMMFNADESDDDWFSFFRTVLLLRAKNNRATTECVFIHLKKKRTESKTELKKGRCTETEPKSFSISVPIPIFSISPEYLVSTFCSADREHKRRKRCTVIVYTPWKQHLYFIQNQRIFLFFPILHEFREFLDFYMGEYHFFKTIIVYRFTKITRFCEPFLRNTQTTWTVARPVC
jgi:hypothetical protein